MKKYVVEFLRDEEGLTATEYAVCAALIVAGLVAAFAALGDAIAAVIDGITAEL